MIYQYNGYRYNRVYIQADSLSEAMSPKNKKALLREILSSTWCSDLDDIRFYYKKAFADWHDPEMWQPWNKCSDTVFLDTAY